jgi:spore coat protein A
MDRKSLFAVVFVLAVLFCAGSAFAQQGTPLPGNAIPQFVDPLPILSVQGGSIETVLATPAFIHMKEFRAQVLPSTFVPADTVNYDGSTWVWGYRPSTAPPPGSTDPAADTYLGPVFVVERDVPSDIYWVNDLGNTATSEVLFWKASVDQTLHWADPLAPTQAQANMCMEAIQTGLPPSPPCDQPYAGPVPAVVHLHGGEVPAQIDGSPDSWWTSDTIGTKYGHKYYTRSSAPANAARYRYPNMQEAAPIWFHDHTLGATRLNVYAGMAGAYIIYDNANPPAAGLGDVAGAATIIPLVIQDRMFDTNGQFYFPNIGINPEHPFWVPEFVGDAILVNGKTWPFLEVMPDLYRFLLLNGSNARAYTLSFKVQGKGNPQIWVISTDGGYLDLPVPVSQLTIMPGERYGVIVDFSGLKPGSTALLQNSARTPFPGGAPVQRSTTGRIMEFRVTNTPAAPAAPNTTFVPTASTPLRSTNIVRLAPNIVTPAQNPTGHTPIRRLTLNEVIGPGGPLEVLVNNTKWSGMSARSYNDFVPNTHNGVTTSFSELPLEGTTEVWEVINLTADAHPIHLHLVQFQLLSRQAFDVRRYTAVYDGSFPGGIFRPAFGPPLPYAPVVGGASDPTLCSAPGSVCGGNPPVTPYLGGAAQGPLPYENGWKDTVIMYPGQVTRIAVRWTPTDLAAGTDPATAAAAYPFDPSGAGIYNYVWHCHIIDHEDNEMMRPDMVQPNPAVGGRAYPASSY